MLWFLALAQASAPDVDALDATLSSLADRGAFAGMVQVNDGEQVLLRQGYGGADPDERCRIGSLSKSFTAAAVHALQDDGVWSVDDPIGTWLPEVQAVVGDGPTLAQLMRHRGGLSELAYNPWAKPPTWEQMAAGLVPTLTVESEPGVEERYSNSGYQLLAAAVATAAEQPYEELLQQRILGRLGLDDTGIGAAVSPQVDFAPRIATPLGLVPSQSNLPRLMPYDYRSPLGGDGSLSSTVSEMVSWGLLMHEGAVLSGASHAELLRPAADSHTAAGWVVEDDGRVWHNGALSPLGAYAYLRWSTEDQVAVALCGSPGVGQSDVELRHVVEAALAGEEAPRVTVHPGFLGWMAALSSVRLHALVALLGVLLAAVAPGPRGVRRGLVGLGVGMALVGAGLSHVLAGLSMGVLALVLGALRLRLAPKPASSTLVDLAAGLLGASAILGGLALLVLFAGWTWLMDNMWTVLGG